MSLTWPAVKDPDEVKDYAVRFGKLLKGGDTIASISACQVITGTVVVASSQISADVPDDTDKTDYGPSSMVTIWFSGGTLDEDCIVLTRVTTTGGRTYDQSCRLRVRGK